MEMKCLIWTLSASFGASRKAQAYQLRPVVIDCKIGLKKNNNQCIVKYTIIRSQEMLVNSVSTTKGIILFLPLQGEFTFPPTNVI